MLTDTEFQTEIAQMPHEQSVLVICESVERSFFGQAGKTFNFTFAPTASVDDVRKLLAEELDAAPNTVHLQVLVRGSDEYETVSHGSIAEAIAASNPDTLTLTLTYTIESQYGCFYLCCAALCAGCCAAGYAAGKSHEKDKHRHHRH